MPKLEKEIKLVTRESENTQHLVNQLEDYLYVGRKKKTKENPVEKKLPNPFTDIIDSVVKNLKENPVPVSVKMPMPFQKSENKRTPQPSSVSVI